MVKVSLNGPLVLASVMMCQLSSCGQDTSFEEGKVARIASPTPTQSVLPSSTGSNATAAAVNPSPPSASPASSPAPSSVSAPSTANLGSGSPTPSPSQSPSPSVVVTPSSVPPTPSAPVTPVVYNIPSASNSDQQALQKCLANWPGVFGPTISNYKSIAASVAIGSSGYVIDDEVQTSTPELILITAGVNIFSLPVYNLRNQNGYYCMKFDVNVASELIVDLACHAKLADSRVQVNVLSSTNGSTAAVGVNVASTVTVNTVDQGSSTTCH